jgi:hypothetical protein
MAKDNPADKNKVDERRDAMRKKLIVGVEYQGGDGTGIANTRDIGAGGLYMTTGADLAIGDPIQMTFGIGGRQLTLGGTVVYADPGQGVGVRFRDPKQEDIDALVHELDTKET